MNFRARFSKYVPFKPVVLRGWIRLLAWSFEGDSHVEWFEGNFAAYEEDKKRRLGIDSVVPHRLKYKQFSR